MPSTTASANASIWIYFRSPLDDEPTKDSQKRYLKYCILCPQKGKSWATAGTTNAKTYLSTRHNITLNTTVSNSSRATSQLSIYNAFRATPLRATPAFNKARYTRAITLFTTQRRLSFSACEWPEWKELCVSLNEEISDQLINSRYIMGRRIDVVYDVFQAQLKQQFYEAQLMVYFSIDLWTSQARMAFLGIAVQWVDVDFTLQKVLLALLCIQSDHSGKNQIVLVLKAINSFNISP